MNKTNLSSRDGANTSAWQLQAPIELQNNLNPEDTFDVLIVGAGITGLTTAILLQERGIKCAIAEARTIGFGTSSGTTAHLNTFFDATYPEIENDFGKEAAKLVAEGGMEAMQLIKDLASRLNIDCDLEVKDGYLFSEDEKQTKELDEIFEASKRAGVEVTASETAGVPVPFVKAIVFKGQGQFHPVKYIQGLAAAFVENGGIILENTLIEKSTFKNGIHTAIAKDRSLKAKNLVYATHLPPGINILDFECAPYRSYVLGVKLTNENYPSQLVYDMQEPYHYFRSHIIDGTKYMIVGGEDHKTGHGDPEQAFKNLENYVRKYYPVAEIAFKWSSQYYVPADGLPYIGSFPGGEENMYVATGYNGNGMMFGTLSAIILADLLSDVENRYAKLFSPSRIKPVAGFPEILTENADVIWRFVADRFKGLSKSLDDLKSGDGKIIDHDGQKLAIYRSAAGEIKALKPVCTHAGCIVNFNSTEKSWDCPCHGGRFDLEGNVLTGPPRQPLEPVKLDDES